MKEQKIYVITDTLREYKHFVLDNGGDFTKYVFVYSAEQLYGLQNPEIVYIGSYWLNQAFQSGVINTLYLHKKKQTIFQKIWEFLNKRR